MAGLRKMVRPWSTDSLRDWPAGKRYLVGVSGGRDSIALLHWLQTNGYRKLIVCHLNHQLRGRSSTADARFVERLAAANGLRVELAATNVRKLAVETKQSIETTARAARYSFFAEVARRRRCHAIFLGHHADDLVETFLINLFRGAGALGQRGIREVVSRKIGNVQLTILRPLLSVWRSEIDDYVTLNRLRFREDASNHRLDTLRNRLRHSIIPSLEKQIGRDIRKTVRRAASIAAEEDALLQEMVRVSRSRLAVEEMRGLPVALQRRTIAQWLRAHVVYDFGFEMVESVRSLLDLDRGPAKVNLTGDRHARRRAGELFIE